MIAATSFIYHSLQGTFFMSYSYSGASDSSSETGVGFVIRDPDVSCYSVDSPLQVRSRLHSY